MTDPKCRRCGAPLDTDQRVGSVAGERRWLCLHCKVWTFERGDR